MKEKDRIDLLRAVSGWVDKHPTPDAPALSLAEAENYTPRQIFSELEGQTLFGRWFVQMIDAGIGAEAYTLRDVLRGFSIKLETPGRGSPEIEG